MALPGPPGDLPAMVAAWCAAGAKCHAATDSTEVDVDNESSGSELLIVEDDEGIRNGLVRALRQAGYVCHAVGDAAAARAVTTPPDLVLLDLGLPDGDGLDLVGELVNRWPLLPV